MFTQIIAQGHFKWTRIDNKNVHLNFGSYFTSHLFTSHTGSVSQFEQVLCVQRQTFTFETFYCTVWSECLWLCWFRVSAHPGKPGKQLIKFPVTENKRGMREKVKSPGKACVVPENYFNVLLFSFSWERTTRLSIRPTKQITLHQSYIILQM